MSDGKVITLPSKSPVQEAIKRLGVDAGALYEPVILIELKRIRAKDPAAWARIRQQVKDTKALSMMDFDRLTAQDDEEKVSAGGGIFPEVEPWPTSVVGTELLDDIAQAIKRYVIADGATIQAAALWATFTWLIDSVQVAPIANITAPEKRCGKSIMLTTLGNLVNRKLQVSNIAPAALFRSIELWSPTLLIDEVDAFLRDNEEARGILNAGFTRDSAVVIRCVGDDHMPTPFRVWGAKALCGIGKIADTLADRSIPLRLRRKLPGEQTEVLRHSDPDMWANLRSRMMRFAQDNAEQIAKARPATIKGLNDRANDCWEPLLAIAEAAGGEWPAIARQAARTLHDVEDDSPSVGVELLTDIKTILDTKQASKMFSATLLEELMADDEAPWPTWNRGKPMTARQLATKLAEFGIKSGTVRIGTVTKKGYSREQFLDVFGRYLSTDTPTTSVTPSQASETGGYSSFPSVTPSPVVTDRNTPQAASHMACDGVTDKTLRPLEVEEDDEDGVDF